MSKNIIFVGLFLLGGGPPEVTKSKIFSTNLSGVTKWLRLILVVNFW
jgi:hypothetical protein